LDHFQPSLNSCFGLNDFHRFYIGFSSGIGHVQKLLHIGETQAMRPNPELFLWSCDSSWKPEGTVPNQWFSISQILPLPCYLIPFWTLHDHSLPKHFCCELPVISLLCAGCELFVAINPGRSQYSTSTYCQPFGWNSLSEDFNSVGQRLDLGFWHHSSSSSTGSVRSYDCENCFCLYLSC